MVNAFNGMQKSDVCKEILVIFEIAGLFLVNGQSSSSTLRTPTQTDGRKLYKHGSLKGEHSSDLKGGKCALVFLVLWWYRPTAFLANQAPVHCGCPAGTHGCDPVSRVKLDQSANPVVVWLGLVSRVVRSSWSCGAFVN